MKIRRYKGEEEKDIVGKGIVKGPFQKYPGVTQMLFQQGVLESWPTQVNRVDLTYDEGVDIVYRFRRMTPARFKEYSDAVLLAAYTEADRYKDEKYKFGKFIVKLNRNEKGRKTAIGQIRSYVSAKETDAERMVYGAQALGYTPTYTPKGSTREVEQRTYLINKVEDILGIPDSTSPGPYVDKQKPYTVQSMTISIRMGLRGERTEKASKKKEIENEDDT